jgi:hypothetical protein
MSGFHGRIGGKMEHLKPNNKKKRKKQKQRGKVLVMEGREMRGPLDK